MTRIMLPYNRSILIDICNESLKNLTKSFDIRDDHETIEKLAILINDDGTAHTTLLAVFYTLLNIDQQMKENICMSESDILHAKLTKFYLDLRNEAVRPFFCQSEMSVLRFVEMVAEQWTVA